MKKMSFEEFKEDAKTRKIEITADNIAEASAKIMAEDEAMCDLLKSNPRIMMLFTIFTAKLTKALFFKEEESEGENNGRLE